MALTSLDPALLRFWRLAEELPQGLRSVAVLTARMAPAWQSIVGVRRDARWDLQGSHQHAVPTAVACLAGVVRLSTAGGDMDLGPGEMVVVAPAAWHAHAPLRPGSVTWGQGLVFGGSDMLLAEPGRELSLLLPAEPAAGLLHALVREADPDRRLALGRELVAQCTVTPGVLREVHPAVWRMGHRLWTSLHRPLHAADVLAAAGVGPRQAHRLFISYFGAPPKQVIREQQLALAAELLREGVAVGQAALACGFPDRRSFTRAWRQAHGTPPTRRPETVQTVQERGGRSQAQSD